MVGKTVYTSRLLMASRGQGMTMPNLLLVVAFVLFVLAALGLPMGRVNLLPRD